MGVFSLWLCAGVKKNPQMEGLVMALSDTKAKAARVPAGKKQIKISDAGGLYLLVKSAGKYWKMKYRFADKEKVLSIGIYPSVSLKEARAKREAAKKLLEKNIDPSQAKQQQRRDERKSKQVNSFEGVAREWLGKKSTTWAESTKHHNTTRLEKHIFPWCGSLPIGEVEASDILAVLQRAESRGNIELAHRLRTLCGQVFRFGVASGYIISDPTRDLQGALISVVTKHMATITEPKKVSELLRAIQAFEGTFVVQCALRMTPYVFVRPGELRHAEWSEIDFDAAEWRIPAEKMKMRVTHIVPLASQVVDILKELQPLTGGGKYVFPSIRNVSRPMSENTVNAALRRIGYGKEEICAHGFRAMASTMLYEQGWNSDVIERQLAHKEGNEVKRTYNHARHLPERVKLMQHWSDYLDGLRAGADVISINRRQAL